MGEPMVVAIETPGLGNQSYLIGMGDAAVVVDVPRDGWRVAAVARAHGWSITHALETHVHNDYLSGALELRAAMGTTIVAPDGGRYGFAHHAAAEGFELEAGDGGLVARATPGHTPEHLSWELQDGAGRPQAIFSGGSLLLGGVGRTDLLGDEWRAELTSAQFESMRRLAELPDEVAVYPTHGAGSFCVAGTAEPALRPTIGSLRRQNPAFATLDPAEFERQLEAGRTRYPRYYAYMAPLNRRGPRLLRGPHRPRALTVPEVREAREAGATLVDVRDRRRFASGHIHGALNIELGESLAAYVGWLLPFDAPICLVLEDPAEEIDAAEELRRIGYDHVLGHLDGGIEAWAVAGEAVDSYAVAGWQDLAAAADEKDGDPGHILDVRQPYEWEAGSIRGSRRIFVVDLPDALAGLDRDRTWLVACRTGARATIAASLLDAAGIPVRPVVDGGVDSLPAHQRQTAGSGAPRDGGLAARP